MSEMRALAEKSNAWPFAEAKAILKRLNGKTPEKGYVLFETGYGPSGLPHIGTFGEVARTSWVRHAFHQLSDIPTRLFAFSDDMDGLRKVPDNLPNKEALELYLGTPLTAIPDPFGTHPSFGEHNNARLQTFLDDFGFEYEFISSTERYKDGHFDATLMKILERFDDVINVILPTLGEERRKSYSPFLPLCPKTGIVLQVPVIERDPAAGTIVYQEEDGTKTEVPVTGGHCKLQWKADWAMRWAALDVDYEMSGKDLIESVNLSGKICRILDGKPPVGFSYELFLDDNGEKISKSRGNGLTVDEWLRYAPPESLAYFMYQKPRAAKRLYFDVIPRQVDEYSRMLDAYDTQEPAKQIDNPVNFIHMGTPPSEKAHLSFNILLNLANVCATEDKSVLWHFITRYRPDASPETAPMLDRLVEYAINYYQDFVRPNKAYRKATDDERTALTDLETRLKALPVDAEAEEFQTEVYQVGKLEMFADQKDWFKALYEILLGQSQGPRMGSFIALYGRDETLLLIVKAIRGDDLAG